MKPHVHQALASEIASPRLPDPRGEQMAIAAGSAALFMACNAAFPIVGGVAAAAVIPLLTGGRSPLVASSSSACPPVVDRAVEAECVARVLLPPIDSVGGACSADGIRATQAWSEWLPWDRLHAGEKVDVPARLPHPEAAGFRYTKWAKGVGQVADWVKSLPDGSRLHVHEYGDGRLNVHRDGLDPARGPATATFHWIGETPEGTALGFGIAAAAVAAVWVLWDR